MHKFKELKQKIRDNKYKIIAGIVIAGGVAYIIINQHGEIETLKVKDKLKEEQITKLMKENADNKQIMSIQQETIDTQQEDINILKSVMSGTVLSNLREATKRQLRYAEGRLRNAQEKGSGISDTDRRLREEEIEFFSKQIDNIDRADEIIKSRNL